METGAFALKEQMSMFDFIRLGIHYIDLAVFDTSY